MSRLLATILIVLLVAGCAQVATKAPSDEPANTGHTDSGGAGRGSM
jgi:uncharacterized protein YceK